MTIRPVVFGSILLLARMASGADEAPRTLVIDGPGLAKVRADGGIGKSPALIRLKKEAEESLGVGPWSVVDKEQVPPSGDKHDYMSVGPYWWPDPKKPDGLPYVRRDGETNPERHEYDNVGMGRMADGSLTLSLAWFLTGDERYARKSSELLRTWFIDEETKMNPNLNFGQAIPGRTEGRGIGIIDSKGLINAVDAAILLEGSGVWSKEDATGLKAWFSDYVDWLRESPLGVEESRTRNNHATWYDAQVAAFALYAGRGEVAREVLGEVGSRRIDSQIEADGAQPHELARTRSWDYSVMNLKGFMILAILGERVGVDLWNHRTPERGGIRAALDFLVPTATGGREWKHEQIKKLEPAALAPLLRWAGNAYPESEYERLLAEVMGRDELAAARFQLTSPPNETR